VIDRLAFRLLLAQVADVATFLAFYAWVGPSVHQERNPILIVLMAMGGLAAVAAFKLGITALVIVRGRRAGAIRRRWYVPLRTIAISAATASGIVGAGFNLASIVSSFR
jgi:hypothetical protein